MATTVSGPPSTEKFVPQEILEGLPGVEFEVESIDESGANAVSRPPLAHGDV